MAPQLSSFAATGRLAAPAKLNLCLHVLGRRPDGYHRLQTIFQLLDFGDELEITVRKDGQIRLLDPLPGLTPEQDLSWRAARLLQQHGRITQGADIRVHKLIPMGGGLGGGSSDAASCLLVLNRLWGLNLSRATLARLGLQLGADVPVFVHGHTAFADGVGEELSALDLPEPWYCVVTPDCPVPTATVFQAPELTRNSPPMTIRALLAAPDVWRNDCWPVVAARFPRIAEAQTWLSRLGPTRLSGTGASLFLRADSRQAALAMAAEIGDRWPHFVARGLNVSPLLAQLEWLAPQRTI